MEKTSQRLVTEFLATVTNLMERIHALEDENKELKSQIEYYEQQQKGNEV